jgi:hypothetical protein
LIAKNQDMPTMDIDRLVDPCTSGYMAALDSCAFRTPQKRRSASGRNSSCATSTCSWAASLRSARSTQLQSPRTPRDLHLSMDSSRSLSSPVGHREKEKVFFTPPPRRLPN